MAKSKSMGMNVKTAINGVKNKLRFRKNQVDAPSTAYEKFMKLFQLVNQFAYAYGVEFVDDWVYNNRSLVGLFIACILWWLICYTAYAEFPSLAVVELIGGVSLAQSVCAKLIVILLKYGKFMSLLTFIIDLFKDNLAGVREAILSNTIHNTIYHIKVVFVCGLSGLIFYSFYPTYDLIFNGNLTPVSPLVVPNIDQQTIAGYAIMVVFNIFVAFYGALLSLGVTSLFLSCVDVYDGMIDLIEYDFKLFDAMCEREGQSSRLTRDAAFRNVLMEIMDVLNYNLYLDELFAAAATIQVACDFYGILAVIFAILANNYMSGYGAAVGFCSELLIVCYIGQLHLNSSEKLIQVIYNAKWYTYEMRYQKDLLIALNLVHNIPPIMVAKLHPLNFETGLMVIRNIYSALMFMLNFLE